MEFYEPRQLQERVILVGVQTDENEDVASSLDELEQLADTVI